MALFLTFEGIDGCGKSTQLELLRARLEAEGRSVLVTREPGGTELANHIRGILLDSEHRPDSRAELLLFGAARAQHVAEVIRPALEQGHVVLSDRFTDSSLAYQGGGLGLDQDFIRQMNDFATAGLAPDLTFLLDINPAVGALRRRAQREDNIEARGLAFQAAVREAYLAIAAAEPERVVMIDGSRTASAVREAVFSALQERLSES